MSNNGFTLTNLPFEKIQDYQPTVTQYHRFEGRPRAKDFDRALKAEVHDALWMVSKQWQMGEFKGDEEEAKPGVEAAVETEDLKKDIAETTAEAVDNSEITNR